MVDYRTLKASMTWEELAQWVHEWIGYGDDVFDDAYSYLQEIHEEETNPEQKAVYASVLKFMDMLRQTVGRYW